MFIVPNGRWVTSEFSSKTYTVVYSTFSNKNFTGSFWECGATLSDWGRFVSQETSLTYKCKPESVQRSREIGVFLQYRGNRVWEGCISLKECISDSSECPTYFSTALDDKYGILLLGEIIAIHDSLYIGIEQIFGRSLSSCKVLVVCSLCPICGDWFPQ